MEQKIVVHTKQGKIHKGITHDFEPDCGHFHFLSGEGGGIPMKMDVDDMKAMFWVKDYLGNRSFVAKREFEEGAERRAIVEFQDGEEIWGTLTDDGEAPKGFFLIPSDKEDNNLRIFVVRSAMKAMRMVS